MGRLLVPPPGSRAFVTVIVVPKSVESSKTGVSAVVAVGATVVVGFSQITRRARSVVGSPTERVARPGSPVQLLLPGLFPLLLGWGAVVAAPPGPEVAPQTVVALLRPVVSVVVQVRQRRLSPPVVSPTPPASGTAGGTRVTTSRPVRGSSVRRLPVRLEHVVDGRLLVDRGDRGPKGNPVEGCLRVRVCVTILPVARGSVTQDEGPSPSVLTPSFRSG